MCDLQRSGQGMSGGFVPIAGRLDGHRVVNALDGGPG